MAQRVLGIDLGAHSVKVAQIEVGFNYARLTKLTTLGVPAAPDLNLERSLRVLSELPPPTAPIDAVSVGVPGDRVLLRLLEIPFADPRKIGPVVGNELADEIPWEMEEVTFDHMLLPPAHGKVLAAAVRSEEIRALLTELTRMEMEPRNLLLSPLAYGNMVRRIYPEDPVLVVDLGHRRTNVCMVHGGQAIYSRTISRAGHQITEALQETFQCTYSEAEEIKHREAFLSVADLEGLEERRRQLAQVTVRAVAPLARELQLTLGTIASKLGLKPERVLLCGGTALLQGIDSYLAVELGLMTEPLNVDQSEGFHEGELDPVDRSIGALAMGLVFEQGGRRTIDLRQGEFSYHSDNSFLKEKMLSIAVSVVMVLIFASFNACLSMRTLQQEEAELLTQLNKATERVFGEPESNPAKVSRTVMLGSKAISSGIPENTAFDILDTLSAKIPKGEKVNLDITRLEIKPGKTYIKGTADSRSAVGDIVKALKEHKECFSKVSTGKISEVSKGKKQFTLNIDTTCY